MKQLRIEMIDLIGKHELVKILHERPDVTYYPNQYAFYFDANSQIHTWVALTYPDIIIAN